MDRRNLTTIDEDFQAAVAHHLAGRVQDAEPLYTSILQRDPNHPDANHNLGAIAAQRGQNDSALPLFENALKADFGREQFWHSYLSALLRCGHVDAAAEIVALGRRHGHLAGAAIDTLLMQHASASQQTGGTAAAKKPKGGSLSKKKIAALENLFNTGQFAALEQQTRQLLDEYPQEPFLWAGLGAALYTLGHTKQAIPAFQQAVKLKPGDAEYRKNLVTALTNLGRAEVQSGNFSDAEIYFRQATEIAPDATLHNELGLILLERKNYLLAEENFRRAVELKADKFEPLNNLGVSQLNLRKYADAEIHLRKALALSPGDSRICGNLGTALYWQGHLAEAETLYLTAANNPALSLKYALAARLMLPSIPRSVEDIADWREHFSAGVQALQSLPVFPGNPDPGIGGFFFQLAYHNADNRFLLEALADVLREKLPLLDYTSPHLADWQHPAGDRRIRIGFASEFLVAHTIAKLYQGIIQHLDRTRFDVVIIHAPNAKRDGVSAFIDSLGSEVINLQDDLRAQHEAIANAKLDILFYPDIGMTPSTYFLAHARLAPVQAVSWGHPDTTGLCTIDYFVSSALIEAENADAHYTERLVRFSHLPAFYQPIAAAAESLTRAELGLPLHGTLYGCPQSLFKLHPDFDSILAAIASGDPTGHIVLLEGSHKHLTPQLRERWKNTFPILLERVCILAEQPQDRFMALMAAFDVLLDPIYFGSGNTLYEAMVYGTPIVTFPAPFMRGRIVAGAYEQLGIADAPVVQNLSDYAPLALALGRDIARRAALRETIRAAGKSLFEDHQVIREFETFIEAALAAAARGEPLPAGWRPDAVTTRNE